MGDSIEETRQFFIEAAEAHLELMAEDDDSLPEPSTTSVDFAQEHEDGKESPYYVVEWLPITVPILHSHAISA